MILPGESIWVPGEALLASRGFHIRPERGDLVSGYTQTIGKKPNAPLSGWEGARRFPTET